MSEVKFSKAEKAEIVDKVKTYFREEMDREIGNFDAEFLIDFFATEVGAYFYNRGVYDAQALLSKNIEHLSDSIFELEKPTSFSK